MNNSVAVIKSAFAAVGGAAVYWLGGLDKLLTALIAVIILDYITGVLGAIHNRTLSSGIGFRGIVKKVLCLTVVALAFVIEELTSRALPLREIVIMFFIANEGLSILENAAMTGLPIPAGLKTVLAGLREKGENTSS